jgi:hypothetical protein
MTPRDQLMSVSWPYSSAWMLLRCRTFGGKSAGKALNRQTVGSLRAVREIACTLRVDASTS